jgi:hypothetical protein
VLTITAISVVDWRRHTDPSPTRGADPGPLDRGRDVGQEVVRRPGQLVGLDPGRVAGELPGRHPDGAGAQRDLLRGLTVAGVNDAGLNSFQRPPETTSMLPSVTLMAV